MTFIKVRNLRRTYRTLSRGETVSEQVIFDGFDLDVEDGEMIAIVGPSGCGKSTLLNVIGGLDSVDRPAPKPARQRREVARVEGGGSIRIDGFPISAARGDARADFINRHIGFIFQFHHLISELSALDNVALPRLIGGERPRQARGAAMEILRKLHLDRHAGKRPDLLSGGERQRVAIARALVNRPRVLLADEPTGSLDPPLKGVIFDLLRRLNAEEGITILLVTHDFGLLHDREERPRIDRIVSLVPRRGPTRPAASDLERSP